MREGRYKDEERKNEYLNVQLYDSDFIHGSHYRSKVIDQSLHHG